LQFGVEKYKLKNLKFPGICAAVQPDSPLAVVTGRCRAVTAGINPVYGLADSFNFFCVFPTFHFPVTCRIYALHWAVKWTMLSWR